MGTSRAGSLLMSRASSRSPHCYWTHTASRSGVNIMNLTLRPMSPKDLARYIVTGTEDYIGELVRAGMPEDAARQNAADVLAESFPEGVPANDNEMFDVLEGADTV